MIMPIYYTGNFDLSQIPFWYWKIVMVFIIINIIMLICKSIKDDIFDGFHTGDFIMCGLMLIACFICAIIWPIEILTFIFIILINIIKILIK